MSVRPLSHLLPVPTRFHVGMEHQRYEAVQNATHPRPLYPDEPSRTLLDSIEAKRATLTAVPTTFTNTPKTLTPHIPTHSIRIETDI